MRRAVAEGRRGHPAAAGVLGDVQVAKAGVVAAARIVALDLTEDGELCYLARCTPEGRN